MDDHELYEKLSREAKESIKPFTEFDHEKAWKEIFKELNSTKAEKYLIQESNNNIKLLLETFGFYYEKGLENYRELSRYATSVKNIALPVINYLSLCATARVEVKLSGSPSHKWTLLSCDSKTKYDFPLWLTKNNGIMDGMGIRFQSSTGKIDFSIQCENSGVFSLMLMGVDYRNNEGRRLLIWINYTSLIVNGENILPTNTHISHDYPYLFKKDVKEKEIITVNVSWFPDGFNEEGKICGLLEERKHFIPVRNIPPSVLNYLSLCATARVDIKLTGSPDHKLTVISCDSEANYRVPEWITKNNQGIVDGYGIVFESNTGKMEFSVQCENEGGLDVWLRGVDYRNNQGQHIPIWINYKNFTINGEEIFHDDTRVWHDKSYHFQKNVKAKEIITVSVSWYPDGYQEPPQK